MQTNTLEEKELTETANEPEPQPEIPEPTSTTTPETTEPETTALVPTIIEQDVIEGEVIVIDPPEPAEDYTPPKQKPYWLLIPLAFILCLSFLGVSLLVPLFTPTATITIIPVERTLTTRAVIQVPGRALLPLTLMQSMSVPATGNRHQNATRATGTITFYNGLLSQQTIPVGTIVTGKDGVQIITDQAATIPAGNPPIYGQVTVPAHAVLAGTQGNIPAYDINTACCATSVVAKNTQAFTGGGSARNFLTVTRTDINNAVTSLLVTLNQSEVAALQAQLHSGEALITPSCNPTVSSDHKPGDEAKQVTVTVSVTCSGIAYIAHEVYQDATLSITKEAVKRFGTGYSLLGDMQVSIVHATITNSRQGRATIIVLITGTWVYQITPGEKEHILKLIAGKRKQQALATLLQLPGIQRAFVTIKGNATTLPDDPTRITIVVVHRD